MDQVSEMRETRRVVMAPLEEITSKKRRRSRRRRKAKKAGTGAANAENLENAVPVAAGASGVTKSVTFQMDELDTPVDASNILPTRLRGAAPLAAPEDSEAGFSAEEDDPKDDSFCFAPQTIDEVIAADHEVERWGRNAEEGDAPEVASEEVIDAVVEEAVQAAAATVKEEKEVEMNADVEAVVLEEVAPEAAPEAAREATMPLLDEPEMEVPDTVEELVVSIKLEDEDLASEGDIEVHFVEDDEISGPGLLGREVSESFDFEAPASEELLASVASKLASVPHAALESPAKGGVLTTQASPDLSRRCLWFLPF